MKLTMKSLLYSNLLILILGLCSATTALANNEVLLLGTDGKQHKVSDYIGKGQWTLVNFWGVDCPPCREEMPELVLLHDEYSKTLVSVLGIAIDFPSFGYPNAGEVSAFIQALMVDFPVLLSDGSISGKMGAGDLQGLPTTFMYTPEGELVAQQVGAIDRKIVLDFIKKHEESRILEKNKKKD